MKDALSIPYDPFITGRTSRSGTASDGCLRAFIEAPLPSSRLSTRGTERRGPVTCHLYDGHPAIEALRFWMNNITFHLTGCGNDVPEGFSMQGLSNNRTVKK